MYVCLYVYMYVYMYVCVYMNVYTSIYVYILFTCYEQVGIDARVHLSSVKGSPGGFCPPNVALVRGGEGLGFRV